MTQTDTSHKKSCKVHYHGYHGWLKNARDRTSVNTSIATKHANVINNHKSLKEGQN